MNALWVQDNVRLGKFQGYSIYYQVTPGDNMRSQIRQMELDRFYLFILQMTGGCLIFETKIIVLDQFKSGDELLESILSDISITKNVRRLTASQIKARENRWKQKILYVQNKGTPAWSGKIAKWDDAYLRKLMPDNIK